MRVRAFFVSDVHLSAARPHRLEAFERFLSRLQGHADCLYILGDLFDLWLGDDHLDPPHPQILDALRNLTESGTEIFVMFGNHDFLFGNDFEARSGARLIDDPTVIALGTYRVLLTHGDTLCTDDVEYQAFRRYTRDPEVQKAFLAKPLSERYEEANRIRNQSEQATELKPEQIMDVNPDAVNAIMREHNTDILIHGHTHRPGIHDWEIDGEEARRFVLGDWYATEQVLYWDGVDFHFGAVDRLSSAFA